MRWRWHELGCVTGGETTEPAAERGVRFFSPPSRRATAFPFPRPDPRGRATHTEENEEAAGRQPPAEGEEKEDEAYAGFKDGRVQRGRPGDIWGSGKRESGPERVYIQRTEEKSCYCYLGGGGVLRPADG